MNGRVYDPLLGRFLSADPNIDGVGDAQGYNRYSYVGNNPLGATDPSGYFSLKDVVMIVAIVVVGIITAGAALAALAPGGFSLLGGISTLFSGTLGLGQAIAAGVGFGFGSSFAGSLLNGGSIGDAFKAGIIGGLEGGVSGGLTFGIGNISGSLGYLGTAVAHGVVQGGLTEATGGEFRHGFYAGFATAAASPGIDLIPGSSAGAIAERVAAAAVVGGTASAIGGGKFANGAVSGAFVRLFNEEAHQYKLGLAAMVHGPDDGVGHAFLVGEKPDGTIEAKGFYPVGNSKPFGPGELRDNTPAYNEMIKGDLDGAIHWVRVDKATYEAAWSEMKSYSVGVKYDAILSQFGGSVCSTVAIRVFENATGITSYHDINTPRGLLNYIRNDYSGNGNFGVVHSSEIQNFSQDRAAYQRAPWWSRVLNSFETAHQ